MRSIYDALPLRLPTVCMVSGNLNTMWFDMFDFTPTGQHGKSYKNILHTGARIIPCRCISIKKILPCWAIYWQSKLSLKLLDFGRKIRNDVHIDTNYCKPKLVSWRWITITVFYTHFLSQLIRNMRSRWRIEKSSIIARLVYFDIQRGRSQNAMPRTLSLSLYIYIYIYISPSR